MIYRNIEVPVGTDVEVSDDWQRINVHLAKDGAFHVLFACPNEK